MKHALRSVVTLPMVLVAVSALGASVGRPIEGESGGPSRALMFLHPFPHPALRCAFLRPATGLEAPMQRMPSGGLGPVTQSCLNQIKMINYFPAAQKNDMWTDWDPGVIDSDFARIASLHANTVRVFLEPSQFGFPTPSAESLDELSQLVTMADQNHLRVWLNLFDIFSNLSDISGSEAWASAIVGPYRNDPRIAVIEVKNEIDPTQASAMTWARALIPYVQTVAGNIPVTVSVTQQVSGETPTGGEAITLPELISALGTAQPDLYSVHQYYYAPREDFYQLRLAQQAAAAQGLPLFVGEVGASTNASDYTSFVNPIARTQASYDAYQDYKIRAAFAATSALKLPPPAPWILWDFAPGSLSPGTAPDQYDFGIFRVDGSPKPAAFSVARMFAGLPPDDSFNNGFEAYALDPVSGYVLPLLWQVEEIGLGTFGVDTSMAYSGHASAEISNSSSSSAGAPGYFVAPTAQNVTPGSSHTATVYVRGKNATGNTDICLYWYATGGKFISRSCAGSLSGTTSWEQMSVTSTAPSNAAGVEIQLTSANNQGTAWFDDVTYK